MLRSVSVFLAANESISQKILFSLQSAFHTFPDVLLVRVKTKISNFTYINLFTIFNPLLGDIWQIIIECFRLGSNDDIILSSFIDYATKSLKSSSPIIRRLAVQFLGEQSPVNSDFKNLLQMVDDQDSRIRLATVKG